MKRLIISLLFVTVSFAQDVLITTKGLEYKGEFIGVNDNIISFTAVGTLYPNNIHLIEIEKLVLADGTLVIDKSISEFIIADGKNTEQIDISKDSGFLIEDNESTEGGNLIPLSMIGGSLIGLSGFLMIINNQKTLDLNADLNETEEFTNQLKSDYDLAYFMLFLGGALIALDNFLIVSRR